jgi:hypothetical protein
MCKLRAVRDLVDGSLQAGGIDARLGIGTQRTSYQ